MMLLVICALTQTTFATDKIKPEEIVAKHLESIGTEQARKSINNRVMVGTATVTFHSPGKGQAVGQAVMASEGPKILIGMTFDNTNYPYEKLGYDGNTFTASFLSPGKRSTLGDFLNTYSGIVKQGLMGGSLSSAWPLLNMSSKRARLEYAGTKKINDREAYAIRYVTSGGSDFEVKLFFDKETFQHVRTEYDLVITAQLGRNPASSTAIETQKETRYKMVEEFSDFKQEGGLTLPHAYKLRLAFQTRAGTYDADWTMNFTEFGYNKEIDASSYDLRKS
jgi:hypothetical protein